MIAGEPLSAADESSPAATLSFVRERLAIAHSHWRRYSRPELPSATIYASPQPGHAGTEDNRGDRHAAPSFANIAPVMSPSIAVQTTSYRRDRFNDTSALPERSCEGFKSMWRTRGPCGNDRTQISELFSEHTSYGFTLAFLPKTVAPHVGAQHHPG